MSFAQRYLEKQCLYPAQINTPPPPGLSIVLVIPCFDEPDLLSTLQSLYNCQKTQCHVEVITVINSSENASDEIRQKNLQTLRQAEKWAKLHSHPRLHFYFLHFPDLPKKKAGVGLARKIGMDEAVRRYNQLNKENGVIVGFDADSLCDDNYLVEIENTFLRQPNVNAASVYFEHPLQGNGFSDEIYQSIVKYELYLRYYIQAKRRAGFPYSYHTLGSSFAVRADSYAREGGMNQRQAGEDFYFLHKVIPLGNFAEINTTRVIPSPRSSHRVPFGTGAAIKKMLNNQSPDYPTYNLEAFLALRHLFKNHLLFYNDRKTLADLQLPVPVAEFLQKTGFNKALPEMIANSASAGTFSKRFFQWFTAFRLLKYLNFVHPRFFQKAEIETQAYKLLQTLNIPIPPNITGKELLYIYRDLDRKSGRDLE